MNSQQPEMITERHHPEEFIKSIEHDPQASKKIYEQFCATCHDKAPEIELGAPKIGVTKDWQLRTKQGIEGLLAVTKNGLNQMPPRGGCFECSDDQLRAAIVYMLPSSKKSLKK
ncbi:MAG: cytochrome c5 family protein [Proteobacteria bacterium]|nr:cytochrome c5 family protein [Pseudomonadota bacterium]